MQYPVPGDADDPLFQAFYAYWDSKRGGRSLPRRKDIDPLEIPELLGHINVIKVHRARGSLRFQYTLWGTFITDLYGDDFTGRFLDEIILPVGVDRVAAAFEQTVATGQPHFWRVPVPCGIRRYASNRRLLLPLSEDDETVTHMIAMMIGDPRDDDPYGQRD